MSPSAISRVPFARASHSPSDEKLMERIASGEQSALSALYERYGKMLKNVIYQVIQDEAESDDVLQESVLQVWREASSYSAALGKPLGWIITIARRRAIDRVRRRAAYCRAKDRFETYVEQEPRSWLRSHTESDNSASDIRHFLEREISRLPIFQREALKLSFFGGLSHREIAARTRTPLGTVKTRLELGLRKLGSSVRAQRGKV
ncbi:MAG: sigma-70 family RNA polymerase sigma factor [Verrucomicrobiota bacterium]|nr:sigma-70 family RNA polymerase sigma factor [Verrucomicrobiota bacterium]